MTIPTVSYIIVTSNRQDEVISCLSSVLKQDYPKKDIIVVDNGSVDKTVDIIFKHFQEVHLVALKNNLGVAAARNRGIKEAKGEICIFIDDDAQLTNMDATRQVLNYFQYDPKIACVSFRIIDSSTGIEQNKSIPRFDKRKLETDYFCGYFCGTGFALKRNIFFELNMFWEELIYSGEELDLSYQLLEKGYKLIYSYSIKVIHSETFKARPKGQWIYFNTRNRCWVAVKNLPWIYAFSTSLIWWGYAAYVSLTGADLKSFLKGIRDSIKEIRSVIKIRRCISKETTKRIKQLSGRLWY